MNQKTNITHFDLRSTPFHINYRLHGSIPKCRRDGIRARREEAITEMGLRLGGLSGNLYEQAYAIESRKLQLLTEHLLEDALHESSDGPTYLDLPEARDAVLDSWRFLDTEGAIELHAVCVMSNHVHVVAAGAGDATSVNLARLMQRHKGFTAQKCNEVLDRVGQPFWSANYFDRTVRRGSWLTVMWYVLNNPVKAGLVEWWGEWGGNYVSPQFCSHFL